MIPLSSSFISHHFSFSVYLLIITSSYLLSKYPFQNIHFSLSVLLASCLSVDPFPYLFLSLSFCYHRCTTFTYMTMLFYLSYFESSIFKLLFDSYFFFSLCMPSLGVYLSFSLSLFIFPSLSFFKFV